MFSSTRLFHASSVRFFIFLFAVFVTTSVSAQWVFDGTGVCTEPNYQMVVEMCSDGEGGVIVVWEDWRGEDIDIYAQRVDPYGNEMWAPGGVPVILEDLQQMKPRICADGFGGVVVVWESNQYGTWDLMGQRLDADGNMWWNDFGASVGAPANLGDQVNARLFPDGTGGAFVAWEDDRNGNWDIYAQHIRGGNGQSLWIRDGIRVCDYAGGQFSPCIVNDGGGGIIIAWRDERAGAAGIYAQRYAQGSQHNWTLDGKISCLVAADKGDPRIISDDAGGAILVWHDARVTDYDLLFAQRINPDGDGIWGLTGTRVSVNYADQTFPDIAPDGAGGAYISWVDNRGADADIYGQRLNQYGYIQWDGVGNVVSAVTGWQSFTRICLASDGGALITWKDARFGQYDIYAQKMDGTGSPVWTANGVALCNETTDNQSKPVIVSDGDGGAIVAWDDGRDVYYLDVYAQRVEKHGFWGHPSATITSVTDVLDDQGRWVQITWNPSRLGGEGGSILQYSIWRAPAGSETWTLLGTEPASPALFFTATVSTPADSNSSGQALYDFRINALTSDAGVFWESGLAAGYSVDNIPPAQPGQMEGQATWNPPSLMLNWPPVSDPDLSHYAVYRDFLTSLPKTPDDLVGTTENTYLELIDWSVGDADLYWVTAVDNNGNESTAAMVGIGSISSTEDRVFRRTALIGCAPNPFNPTTEIRFELAQAGLVSLCVFDVNGALVRRLVQEQRAAGVHRVAWGGRDDGGRGLSSGVYFYRLEADAFRQTKRIVLLK